MPSSGSVPAGTRVGRYEIVSLLRQGGMGEVYAAEDSNLGRRVALKILPKHRTSDPERVARFVREARASSTLNHPSIVAVHDAGSEGDVHFLAMELIDGQALSEWMRRRRNLEAKIEVMAQVADGLARAHDAGIVHRDLKPDNVMVTSDGRAKIVDFGVAKLTERLGERTALSGVTTPTSRVGTTAYMSPEQIEGKPIDRRTDVFAFGVVLYELLSGANPFAAAQYADTIHNVVHLEPSLDRIPRELRRIVRRCLRKEPELRYDSMRDVALDLREAAPDHVATPRRGRVIVGMLGIAFAVAAAIAAWRWIPRPENAAMMMSRLTNHGRVARAAISPDGKYLVYAAEERAGTAVYVEQIATSTVTRIVEPASFTVYDLKVAPDGDYAFYAAATFAEPNVVNVFQIPLFGGAPRQVASNTEAMFTISPDGTRIAFVRLNALDREFRLTIAAVDGSGETIILRRKAPQFIQSPVWAVDGKGITFVTGTANQRKDAGLFRIDIETSAITRLVTPQFPGVGSYAWLPDGSGALATVYEREQPPQIWFIPTGETTGRKITSEVSAYFCVTPTADSKSFSAVRDATESNIYTIDLEDRSLATLHALTTGPGNSVGGGGVTWIGDRQVIYSTHVGEMSTFVAVDVNGGAARRLIQSMTMWGLTVSNDGSRIAFVSDKSGSPQVWVADANGANPRQVTNVGNASPPSFTPDGKSIVYMRSDDRQLIYQVSIDDGAQTRLTDRPSNRPVVSPDGKWLLCRLRSTEPNVPLWRTALVPLDGHGETRYFEVPRYGGDIAFQWQPSGKGFVFVDAKDGIPNLWRQDLDGSEPRQQTFFESGELYGFGISPDGKRVALSRGESSRDVVLIRNFR